MRYAGPALQQLLDIIKHVIAVFDVSLHALAQPILMTLVKSGMDRADASLLATVVTSSASDLARANQYSFIRSRAWRRSFWVANTGLACSCAWSNGRVKSIEKASLVPDCLAGMIRSQKSLHAISNRANQSQYSVSAPE
jgi:hypothetical protein